MPPRTSLAAACLFILLLPLGDRLEAARPPAHHHRKLNAFDQGVIERVRARAAARLESAECRQLLTDFKDGKGRTLESNLEPFGVSPARYLLDLPFVDGSPLPACKAPAVAMAVNRGMPRVYVCPLGPGRVNSRLSRIEFTSGSLAEAMVIHEMLHTLGLGENPPTTFEITARVRERCR
jgi:hypothetical protein